MKNNTRQKCIYLSSLEEEDLREFLDPNHAPLINIGCGKDRMVKEITAIVAEVVGYNGNVRWDQDKSDGKQLKLLDISKIKELR